MISKLNCKRCGHQWIRRKEELPRTCPRCRSPYWDKEKRKTLKYEYLSVDNFIQINKDALRDIPVKKSDKHEVLSMTALMDIANEHRNVMGDIWDKAVYLISELTKKHAFASANRRTAMLATFIFLEKNGYRTHIRNHKDLKGVMQGIREEYYSRTEIRDWLIKGEIRGFNR